MKAIIIIKKAKLKQQNSTQTLSTLCQKCTHLMSYLQCVVPCISQWPNHKIQNFYMIILYWFFWNSTSWILILFTSQTLHILLSPMHITLQKKPLNQLKTEQNKQKPTSILHLSHTSSFTLVTLCAVVCHLSNCVDQLNVHCI